MKSLTQLYRSGMGPSSSHTIGVQSACKAFLYDYPDIDKYKVILYGSLAKTGKGHRTDKAVVSSFENISGTVEFDFLQNDLPHPNTPDIIGYKDGKEIARRRAMSIGGSAVGVEGETLHEPPETYPHKNADSIKYIKVWCNFVGSDVLGAPHTGQNDIKAGRSGLRPLRKTKLRCNVVGDAA